MFGFDKGAYHSGYQRYMNKFTQVTNQRVFGEMSGWFFYQITFNNYTLDFDSTGMNRCGEQQRYL